MAAKPPKPPSLPLASLYTQMFPPRPSFTERDVPDLTGKVYIVTGSNTGVGKEVSRILYAKNAKVYMAARSDTKAKAAMQDIEAQYPKSLGSLVFQRLDLADLADVSRSAKFFLSQEQRLHGLINNAAVQALQNDKLKTAQGHEIHLGVNAFGTFLFTKLLTPKLVETASKEAAGAVRIVWVSSLGTETVGEKSKGISTDYAEYWPALSPLERYGVSKAANWLYGVEFARRYRDSGVLSLAVNPGHLKSDLYREMGRAFRTVIRTLLCYPPVYGAYTELFAALSPSITMKDSGSWVAPWGRLHPMRKDLLDATKSSEEGGNGHAEKFWEWSEGQVKDFV